MCKYWTLFYVSYRFELICIHTTKILYGNKKLITHCRKIGKNKIYELLNAS